MLMEIDLMIVTGIPIVLYGLLTMFGLEELAS